MKPRLLQTVRPKAPTQADLDKAAVHEARNALAGREECACRLCARVAAELDKAAIHELAP